MISERRLLAPFLWRKIKIDAVKLILLQKFVIYYVLRLVCLQHYLLLYEAIKKAHEIITIANAKPKS